MIFKLIRYLGGMITMLLTVCACGSDTEAIVRTKVNERVGEFRAKRLAECEARLLARAEKMADSLLIQEAINALNDSLARSRPGRPDRPPAVPPLDSTPVKPLFDQ